MSSRARFSSAVTDIQSLLGDADPAAADLDDATRTWLLQTRQAIVAQPRTPGRGRPRSGVRYRRRGTRRRTLVAVGLLAVAVGLAAALAAGLIAASPASRGPARSGSQAGSGRPASTGPAETSLTAAQFLGRAAAALLRQSPPAPPGPNQFVYTETETSGGHLSRTWLSANGERAGQSSQGPVPTCAQQAPSPPAPTFYCVAAMTAGYLPHLPTRPDALRRYLTSIRVISPDRAPGGTPNWAANDTGKAVDYLMSTTYLLPAQQAALFQLLAHTPGFTIVPGVHDAIGRPGVAIRWTYLGGTADIIVSPATYAYLGDRTTYPGESPAQFSGSALIKLAIVDHAGQRP
jgi:hypothetical protein